MIDLLKKNCKYFLLLLGFIFFAVNPSEGQKPKSAEKQQKEFLKKEEKSKKAGEKQHKKDLKKHQKSQGKATNKRMKESAKKSERVRANKKEPFLKRLFTRKK